MKFLIMLRKVMGKITDFMIAGRKAGLWNKQNPEVTAEPMKDDTKIY